MDMGCIEIVPCFDHCAMGIFQVHAYVQCSDNRTAYLSELKSSSEVIVANADGRSWTSLVGRTKIEARPLVRCS